MRHLSLRHYCFVESLQPAQFLPHGQVGGLHDPPDRNTELDLAQRDGGPVPFL